MEKANNEQESLGLPEPAPSVQPGTPMTGMGGPSPREVLAADGADTRLLLPAIIMGFFFIRFIFLGSSGISVPIFIAALYSAVFLYMRWAKINADRGSVTLFLLVVVTTIPYALYDDSAVSALGIPVLVCLVVLQLFTMFSRRRYPRMSAGYLTDLLHAMLVTPFGNMSAAPAVIRGTGRAGKGKTVWVSAAGLLAGFFLLMVLGAQLSAADAAFEAMFSWVRFSFLNQGVEYLLEVFLGLPFALLLFGLLYGLRYNRRTDAVKMPGEGGAGFLPPAFTLAVVLPVCALYLMYLFSQLAYFFSAFSGFLPDGFTYAEYARRGFFELCAVAVFNACMITALLLFTKRSGAGAARAQKGMAFFLALFSLVLVATALSKMLMYMSAYGLTLLRLYTAWFMLLLAVVFVCIMLRLLRRTFPVVQTVTAAGLVMFLVLFYADAGGLAAAYNLNAYRSGQLSSLDVEMLRGMSDAAVPVLIDISKNETQELRETADDILAGYAGRIRPWRTQNVQSLHAQTLLSEWQTARMQRQEE